MLLACRLLVGIGLVLFYQWYKSKSPNSKAADRRNAWAARGRDSRALLEELLPEDMDVADPQVLHRLQALQHSRQMSGSGERRAVARRAAGAIEVEDEDEDDEDLTSQRRSRGRASASASRRGGGSSSSSSKSNSAGSRERGPPLSAALLSAHKARNNARRYASGALGLGDVARMAFDGRHSRSHAGLDEGEEPAIDAMDEFVRHERLSAALSRKSQEQANKKQPTAAELEADLARRLVEEDGEDDDD